MAPFFESTDSCLFGPDKMYSVQLVSSKSWRCQSCGSYAEFVLRPSEVGKNTGTATVQNRNAYGQCCSGVRQLRLKDDGERWSVIVVVLRRR
jgi:hypothetical protein